MCLYLRTEQQLDDAQCPAHPSGGISCSQKRPIASDDRLLMSKWLQLSWKTAQNRIRPRRTTVGIFAFANYSLMVAPHKREKAPLSKVFSAVIGVIDEMRVTIRIVGTIRSSQT